MTILWLDFETKSRCNLLTRGSYNYAQDPSTQVLCMGYAFDDEDVQTWTPSEPFPSRVSNHFASGQQIRCHNASFDRLITEYVVCLDFYVRVPRLEQFYCTAAQARANCAPGSLEDAGRFAGAGMRKDHRGAQLIRLLSIPQPDGAFNDDPVLMQEMVDYCAQDVRAMRAISQSMRELSPEELADYHINERINDRGVLVDVPLAKAAMKYAAQELKEIQELVADITKGAVPSVRSPRMRQWVQDRLGPEALKLMTVYKDGEAKQSIDKTVRANLLALAEEDPDQVPPEVADVIQCADDLWASSVAKFERMSLLADEEDSRVRGAFVFNGGAATGRYSSYGLQAHNMGRKTAKNPVAVREAMLSGAELTPTFGARITDVLKSMLRPAMIPKPGHKFVVLDWKSIEACVNPWLSKHLQAEEVLNVFRSGKDIYIREASSIFHCTETEVTPDKRSIGKVAVLSLGFGGGDNAFEAMGRNYGVVVPKADQIRVVKAWRRANPWARAQWTALETAYTSAMRHKGYEFAAGRVAYLFDGLHLWYALPSQRVLCYPYARFDEDGKISYAKAAWKPKADAKEWPRARLWHGIACENVTQAVANDLLRGVLRQVSDVVLHTHDELVIETTEPDAVLKAVERIMITPPDWAAGLPLAVESKVMSVYGK